MLIKHIDDLLPAIEGRSEFVVIDKGEYTVIDYLYLEKDSFDDPRRLECRGIKFGQRGEILARPFHKFFNLGEKEQPSEVDFSQDHRILEKLDGSMIHPALVNDELRLMTRKGCTDVAAQAEELFLRKPGYFRFMDDMMHQGCTPIFEYIGPKNRIVLRYDDPQLVLLAVRGNYHGTYKSYYHMVRQAAEYGVPVVSSGSEVYDTVGDIHTFLTHARELKDKEGYVIAFDDGHMLKIKADEYLRQHRALDDMSSKKKVLALVLQGFEDDIMSMLDEADAEELREFATQVNQQVMNVVVDIQGVDVLWRHLDQKDFAIKIVPHYEKWQHAAMFKCRAGEDPVPYIKKALQKNLDLVTATWRGQ